MQSAQFSVEQRRSSLRDRIQPKLTEEFLLSLDGVIDASVWFDSDQLRAQVIVHEDVPWTSNALQQQCLLGLGIHQTPRSITVSNASKPPTFATISAGGCQSRAA